MQFTNSWTECVLLSRGLPLGKFFDGVAVLCLGVYRVTVRAPSRVRLGRGVSGPRGFEDCAPPSIRKSVTPLVSFESNRVTTFKAHPYISPGRVWSRVIHRRTGQNRDRLSSLSLRQDLDGSTQGPTLKGTGRYAP